MGDIHGANVRNRMFDELQRLELFLTDELYNYDYVFSDGEKTELRELLANLRHIKPKAALRQDKS